MRQYYITDRRSAGGVAALLGLIARNLQAGVDMIQVREKDLPARALAALLRDAISLPNPHGTRVLVNERLDVALATGAHGVHLPADSIPTSRVRRFSGGFLIGKSTHCVEEAIAAQNSGADFVVFGPVFDPLSKASYLPARGLGELADVCRAVSIPVYALGGITIENAPMCEQAGAAGIAGITLFQREP